jgi:hypothetical protein
MLIDEHGDLMVRNGSLVVGDCTADVAERILRAWPGEFKDAPLLGGSIDQLRHGAVDPFWRGNVIQQLRSQGVDLERLDITEQGIEVVFK